jgi:hypothetical protein
LIFDLQIVVTFSIIILDSPDMFVVATENEMIMGETVVEEIV